jgi:hypothetical protein
MAAEKSAPQTSPQRAPTPAARAAPPCRAALVQELLRRVEATTAAWAVRFTRGDDRPLGELLAVDGGLCLVRLAERREPLGELLRKRHPEAAGAIASALANARAEQRPLGAALADLGAVPSALVRDALLDQFAQGLVTIATAEGGPPVEVPLSVTRPVTTALSAFPPVEVQRRAIAALHTPLDDVAGRAFEEHSDRAKRAVLVLHGALAGGAPVVVAARGFTPRSVADCADLARWVDRVVRPTALVASGETPRVVRAGGVGCEVLGVASRAQCALFFGLDPLTRTRVLDRLWREDATRGRP